ncbi:MAG: RsmE family RNA methyltransferase [Verrucomicrobiota bacterium]
MPDHRVFHPPLASPAAELRLSAEESHHLVTVNRARAGDPVTAFDGTGTEWTCSLADANRRAAVLRVETTRIASRPAGAITLVQSLPKGGVMDDIVRHATELGAAAIEPVVSTRTQVHLDGHRSDKKTDKWRTTALEAAKQCGTPFLPVIGPVRSLVEWLAAQPADDATLLLIASLHPGAKSLKTVLSDWRAAHAGASPAAAVWLVGPEGDFTPEEIATLTTAGYRPVTLGPLVLRCDTAATCALSILRHELAG